MTQLLLHLTLFLVCFVAVTQTRQQDNFYFDPAPIDRDVVEGDEIRLRCDVSSRRHIEFYWTQSDRQVDNTSRRFQEDSDLRITRVDRRHDSGPFRCIATNVTTGVSLQSTTARLNILWLDTVAAVDLRGQENDLTEGVDLQLRCTVTGNAEPQIEWFKNNVRIFSDERVRAHKTKLRIQTVTAGDNGVYSCSGSNLAGHVTSLYNFVLNVPAANTPQLIPETFRQLTLAKLEEPAILDCQFTGALITEWYFQDERLATSAQYTIHPNNSLVVHVSRAGDAGAYLCVGIGEGGPVQTFMTLLKLANLGNFTAASLEPSQPPQTVPKVISIGNKFEVMCISPEGLPTPTMRWLNPDKSPVGEVGRVKAVNGTLTLSNAQETDTGHYSCEVSNMAGSKERKVWLVVSVEPEIVRGPLSERVMEDEMAMFDCRVVGTAYPVTQITWRKIGSAIDMTDGRFVVNKETGTLTILQVKLGDEGNYACLVNTTGYPLKTSINAHLYVKKKLKFKPEPVTTKLELETKAEVPCRADGDTQPKIWWERPNEESFPDGVSDKDGMLTFDSVKDEDTGYYTCIATNNQGKINTTIHVSVVMRPQFKVRPVNKTAMEGHPIMLHCMAIGHPSPTIQWDKNINWIFDPDRIEKLANGSLYIKKVYMEDMGKYGCTAGNNGGLIRTEMYLHVEGAGYADIPRRADNFNMMKTIIIAVCSAVAYLAIVIGLTVYCSIRLVKAKNLRKQKDKDNATGGDKTENGTVPTEHTELMDKKERDSSLLKSDDNRSHMSGVSSQNSSQSQASSRGKALERLAFPRHNLQTLGMLGKGQFGDVFLAKAHCIVDGQPDTLVVVKSLLTRDDRWTLEFRREMEMYARLNHEHVAKVLGHCREMEPQFLISEYCDWGDLKQFLWATRKDNGKRNVKVAALTVAQKTNMCHQVAGGMEHLANYRYIHRDLAARNVLLSSTLDIKVSSLALSRDVYATEYAPWRQQLVPLRWMSPESVLDEEWSTKSDVWSFGVFCWEMFTLGDLPYKAWTDEQVVSGHKVGGGVRLDAVLGIPDEMWRLIQHCMSDDSKDRPTFSEVIISIGDMMVDSDL